MWDVEYGMWDALYRVCWVRMHVGFDADWCPCDPMHAWPLHASRLESDPTTTCVIFDQRRAWDSTIATATSCFVLGSILRGYQIYPAPHALRMCSAPCPC